jgi:transcriptional regulator GlxA family with amidase domain
MEVAILIFQGLTVLDAIGPYEVMRSVPGWEVRFVAPEPGEQRADSGSLGLVADHSLEEVGEPDIVLVPGGPGNRDFLGDERVLGWLQAADRQSRWTTSVCTGSLVLGAAGLLDGKRATSHWLYVERLAEFGAEPVRERVVFDGKTVTAAGVSAGIDMALHLVAREAGDEVAQAVQLAIEYDPHPPFAAGSPAAAPAGVVSAVRAAAAQEDAWLRSSPASKAQ